MPGIRTIILYFADLFDVPVPEEGKFLRWGKFKKLENADAAGGGDRHTYVQDITAVGRLVDLPETIDIESVAVYLNTARQVPGVAYDFVAHADHIEFNFDLEPEDTVQIDYARS